MILCTDHHYFGYAVHKPISIPLMYEYIRIPRFSIILLAPTAKIAHYAYPTLPNVECFNLISLVRHRFQL